MPSHRTRCYEITRREAILVAVCVYLIVVVLEEHVGMAVDQEDDAILARLVALLLDATKPSTTDRKASLVHWMDRWLRTLDSSSSPYSLSASSKMLSQIDCCESEPPSEPSPLSMVDNAAPNEPEPDDALLLLAADELEVPARLRLILAIETDTPRTECEREIELVCVLMRERQRANVED